MRAEYKRDVSRNYLILHGENPVDTASYQVRMLTGNAVPSILKCRIQGLDGRFLFYYDITSRQSLASFYEQKKLKASDLRIIFKHIIPNCLAPIIVQATLGVAMAILTAAGLSFVGLGISPPTPEWGSMLSSARSYIRDYAYMTMFPGLAIMITIFALNVLGDGLRDALDPKQKK